MQSLYTPEMVFLLEYILAYSPATSVETEIDTKPKVDRVQNVGGSTPQKELR